jgi:hypothetical protein
MLLEMSGFQYNVANDVDPSPTIPTSGELPDATWSAVYYSPFVPMKGLMQTLNAVPSQLARTDGRTFPVLIGPAPGTPGEAPSQTDAPSRTDAPSQTDAASQTNAPTSLPLEPQSTNAPNQAGLVVDNSAPVVFRRVSFSLALFSALVLLF